MQVNTAPGLPLVSFKLPDQTAATSPFNFTNDTDEDQAVTPTEACLVRLNSDMCLA